MSLQVWLPFTSSILQDNGIKGFSLSNVGSPNLSNDGKLGKCLNRVSDGTGIKIPSNLIEELGVEYSMAIWVKPLGNHTHYNGTFISSGDWNASQWAFGVSQDNTKVDVAGPGFNKYINCSVPVNQWTHLCCVIKNGVSKLYKNGNYIGSLNLKNGGRLQSDTNWTCIQRETYAGGYFAFNGKLNDLRIYDHALSLSEIKELSRGLIAHYPLKDPYIESTKNLCTGQRYGTTSNAHWEKHTYSCEDYDSSSELVPTNVASHFTISTTGTSTGWNGGGSISTNSGKFSIKPSTTYCYSTYIKASDNFQYTTPNFLYRYEYPDSGSSCAEGGLFSKSRMIYIGDGWYRCWGVFTSNAKSTSINLMFFTYPNKTVEYWLACPQLEEKDHLTPYVLGSRNDDTSIEDTSGNGHNGLLYGNISTVNSSSRYNNCYFFKNGDNDYITTILNMPKDAITMNLWFKSTSPSSSGYTATLTSSGASRHYEMSLAGKTGFLRGGFIINGTRYVNNASLPNKNVFDGKWHMLTSSYNGHIIKRYIDGENAPSNINVEGSLAGGEFTMSIAGNFQNMNAINSYFSDVRIYGTALSNEDILQLYHTSAKIAKNGTMMSQGEFIEDNNLSINKNGNVISTKFIEDSSNVKITKSKELHTYNLMEV